MLQLNPKNYNPYEKKQNLICIGRYEYKATKYYREYLELKGLSDLTFLYEEKKHCIPSLLKLNKILEREGMDDENDIANVLKYAKELPNLQRYCQGLQNQVQDLKYQNQKLERDLQVRKKQMLDLTEVENMHRRNVDTLQDDIDRLLNERRQLQQFVLRFRNSNEKYLKIKDAAEEQVNRLLTDEETLLDLALNAVIEALRMNPDRYKIIYDSKYDSDDNVSTSAFTKPQDYYYDKYHEGLVELAKGFFNILSRQLVDNTMVAAVKEQ